MPEDSSHSRRGSRRSNSDPKRSATSNDKDDFKHAPDPATAPPELAKRYISRSVERAISVLDLLQESAGTLSLAQVSTSVELPKSTVFRLLFTLEKHRYVERDADGSYRLGLGFLGMQSRELAILQEHARPVLEKLRTQTGETASLGVLSGADVVYVQTAPSLRGVRMARSEGARDPMHCTALGKAIASELPEDQVREALDGAGLPRRTHNTITTVEDYLEELATVRRRGYSVDDGENDPDGRCVAVPIPGTRLPAALSISGPSSRFLLKDMAHVATLLKDAANQIAPAPDAYHGDSGRSPSQTE